MYGWRGKIGVMMPANNTVLEPEFAEIAPDGVTVHATRMITSRSGHASVEGLQHVLSNVARASEELSVFGANVYLYACLSTSFVNKRWETEILKYVHANVSSSPVITALGATFEALEAYGAKKIALLCVYGDELMQRGLDIFEDSGYEVALCHSLKKSSFREIAIVDPFSLYSAIRCFDLQNVDLICILGTDIATFPVIRDIERDFRIPVISSNLALFWSAMRAMELSYKGCFESSLFSR
jgi:maleate cis-trans isomerase